MPVSVLTIHWPSAPVHTKRPGRHWSLPRFRAGVVIVNCETAASAGRDHQRKSRSALLVVNTVTARPER